MSKSSRNRRPYTPKRVANVCRQSSCCERPAPIWLAQARHDRDEMPDTEDWWSTECFNCGYVCRCEV